MDFDDAVFAHVREAVGAAWDDLDPDDPAVQTAVAGLRRECTTAKETLSADTEVMIPVLLPALHTMVRLGRAEFEDMIRPSVAETVEALRRAVDVGGRGARRPRRGAARRRLVADPAGRAAGVGGARAAGRRRRRPEGGRGRGRGTGRAEPARRRTAETEVVGEESADAPVSPPLAFDAAPSAARSRRVGGRPRAGVLAAAAVAVAVTFGVSASVATGIGPVAVGAPAEAADAAPAADAAEPVDPWTGDPLTGDAADPGIEAGTPGAVTTPAGPRREPVPWRRGCGPWHATSRRGRRVRDGPRRLRRGWSPRRPRPWCGRRLEVAPEAPVRRTATPAVRPTARPAGTRAVTRPAEAPQGAAPAATAQEPGRPAVGRPAEGRVATRPAVGRPAGARVATRPAEARPAGARVAARPAATRPVGALRGARRWDDGRRTVDARRRGGDAAAGGGPRRPGERGCRGRAGGGRTPAG